MAQITHYPFIRHLRAEPNQYILHFSNGRLRRKGPGLAYWFRPLSAAVMQLPVEDIETTFILNERSSDFQEVSVQVTLAYRISDPEKAAQRINFTLSMAHGSWLEKPLERLAGMWCQWARHPVRMQVTTMPVVEALRSGAKTIREALDSALRANPETESMGLALVSVQVDQVAAMAEVEKALQVPVRESIQQKADEATFQRRALAVEKERAIKENELETEIELARRQEDLIRREGDNQMLAVHQDSEQQKFSIESEAERKAIAARGSAQEARIRADGEAAAKRLLLETETEYEERRVQVWKEAPSSVILGFALQSFAEKVKTIQHLNLTPDLLGEVIQRLILDRADTNDEKKPATPANRSGHSQDSA